MQTDWGGDRKLADCGTCWMLLWQVVFSKEGLTNIFLIHMFFLQCELTDTPPLRDGPIFPTFESEWAFLTTSTNSMVE